MAATTPSGGDRFGFLSLVRAVLDARSAPASPVRAALFGAVVGTLALLAATGVALSAFYAPSTTDAWASVVHLERDIPGGAFVRALHLHATSGVLVLLALHLSAVALAGAWRAPREGQWWLSLALLGAILGSAMTGALLPWDQKGYWASQVETAIMASAPVVGDLVKSTAIGGNDLGNLTLTRYFTAHALLVPGALAFVLLLLLGLRRVHGDAPASEHTPALAWWPDRAIPQLLGALIAFAGLAVLAALDPAPLDGPADPTSGFPARPAWYFRALFVLRKAFEGPLEPVATMVIPGVLVGALAVLPFLDKTPGPLGKRLAFALPVPVFFVIVALATWWSFHKDSADKPYQKAVAEAEVVREKAMRLAENGVPAEGPLFMLANTPEERGKRLFAAKCAGCHPVSAQGGEDAPDLGGFGHVRWLTGLISHPESPDYFGKTKVEGMEPFEELGPEKLARLAAFVQSLAKIEGTPANTWPAEFNDGKRLFDEEGCTECHPLDPGIADAGPNLNGWGSDAWLTRLLNDPGHDTFYGKDNEMPSYKERFDDRQKADVIAFLRVLQEKPLAADARLAAAAKAPGSGASTPE